MIHSSSALIDLIEGQRPRFEAVLVQTLRNPPSGRPNGQALADPGPWVAAVLDALLESLRTGSKAPCETFGRRLCHESRFSEHELEKIADLLRLPEAMLPILLEHLPIADLEEALCQLLSSVRSMAVGFLSSAGPGTDQDTAELQAEAHLQLSESERLREMIFALLEVKSLEKAVKLACVQARHLSGALGSAIVLTDSKEGGRWTETSGAVPNVPAESPAKAPPAPRTPTIELPLLLRGREQGSLTLFFDTDPASHRDFETVRRYAVEMSRALEHAQFHEQHERLAVLEERHKLAQELHDSVTQSLYGVTMYGEAAARLLDSGNSAKASELLRELCETSLEGLREARRMLYELRPPALTEEGLVASLEARLAAVERRTGLEATLSVDPQLSLSQNEEAEIFGIAIEALNNVIRHAGAQHVTIRLAADGTGVFLVVEDDGKGFDTRAAETGQGMGLSGMRERAARIGGELSIASGSSQGTRIELTIPAAARNRSRQAATRQS